MAAPSKTHVQMKDPANATNVQYAQSAEIEGGRVIAFMYGMIDGIQYAWTRLENAQSGDKIWINMTTNGGGSWQEYGHFTITNPGSRNYTEALKTDASNQVRMQGW